MPKAKSETTFEETLREATRTVEDELKLEDIGWTKLGQSAVIIDDAQRVENVKLSRLYQLKDPLATQAIRLWTDYTFGSGLTWNVDKEQAKTKSVLEAFWNSRANASVLSPRGQRVGSDKLLIDGEVFFAIFLGPETKVRYIDPLEITEIVSNPDDAKDVRYYKREWMSLNDQRTAWYRSVNNIKDEATKDSSGATVQKTDEALIYHLAYRTITQRGNPLLLPALDWITQYRRFLASRIAIMLALARFAWRSKVTGGQTAVNAIKAKTNDKEIAAGAHMVENMGVDTQPIKTDTGASNAWQDGRMIRLMICAAVGIPEQYFGDISTGSLAAAQTVELPMIKMFGSYQQIWADAYKDINEVVLEHNNVPEKDWYVDMDFPPITPLDAIAVADALSKTITALPQLASSNDVIQQALMALGINDPAQVIEQLNQEAKGNSTVALIRELRRYRESLQEVRR